VTRPRILIVGGGFAGLWAARTLGRMAIADVTLVDRRATSDFLPLLPDVAGGRIPSSAACWPLTAAAARFGFRFCQDDLAGIDRAARRAVGRQGEYDYDWLLLACGVEPAFHGQDALRPQLSTLSSLADAVRLAAAVDAAPPEATVVVVGGGYTGIEIATHVQRRLQAAGQARPVRVLEAAPELLGALPERVRRYVRRQLEARRIAVQTGTRVSAMDPDGALRLSDGSRIAAPLTIWSAGVAAAPWVAGLGLPQGRQGRLAVDACLRLDEHGFAAGDIAGLAVDGIPLRLGVQAAVTQGVAAARNIAALCRGRAARPYRPWDPGYIVPLANGRGCGSVMGLPVQGPPAAWLHYLLCAYRSWTWPSRRRILRGMIG